MSINKRSEAEKPLYQAIGVLEGELIQDEDRYLIATADAVYPVIVGQKIRKWLDRHPDCRSGFWSVYPRQMGVLFFKVNGLLKKPATEPDIFRIAGTIHSQDSEAGTVKISIRRNSPAPAGLEKTLHWRPFLLELIGELPGFGAGHFCQVECVRFGNELEILNVLTPAPKPRRIDPPRKKPRPNPVEAA